MASHRVSTAFSRLLNAEEEAAEELAVEMITACSMESDIEWDLGRIRISAVLPTQEMVEDSTIKASRGDGVGTLDVQTREPLFQRLLLSRCLRRIDAYDFEIENEADTARKFLVLSKLPNVMFDRMWAGFMASRNAMAIALMGMVGDVVKKSPARPSGGDDGDSSSPRDESPSTPGTPGEASPS